MLFTYKKLLSVKNSVLRQLDAKLTLEEAFIIIDFLRTSFRVEILVTMDFFESLLFGD